MSNSETTSSLDPIAIVGMSCRFPGAKTASEFWENLKNGVESVSFFTEEELTASGIDAALMRNPNYVRAKAMIEDMEAFDASFFGFTPREAEMTDPQHRLFLECAWEAMENAGYDSGQYHGRIGVYAGIGLNTYLLRNLASNPGVVTPENEYQLLVGNDKDFVPTRVSYKLNLKGPSVNVNTACSTSLVAIHLACQSLLSYQCDMALVGAATLRPPKKEGHLYQVGGVLSPDGHCRAFDAKAQGMVGGNGVGIVALKRLEDALADGDTVYAVIKGTAINNDGSAKVGYTAPGVNGQAEAIAEAMAVAGVHPETVTYIEAHGTGTPLGDPIEIAALTQAFRAHTRKKAFCAVGSVKTNIGHLDTAAGVAGLIKTVLALQHRQIPPSLHFQQPNPQIDFANSPFYVNTKLTEWKGEGNTPRRAGVSSFGIGGTNAHVVLEEAPQREESGPSRSWQVVVVSAKSETALERATENLANFLKNQTDIVNHHGAQTLESGQGRGINPRATVNLADVAYTLQVGRRGFPYRRMLVCKTAEEAVTALNSLDPKKIFTGVQEAEEPPVVFLFSGQGAQYVDMGRELYETEPTFRQTMDRCDEILKHSLGKSLMGVMYPGCHATGNQKSEIRNPKLEIRSTKSEARNTKYETQGMLGETAYTQPALFALEYALAKLWMEWGIRPRAMIGHSIGEYVAACLAGVFSLEEALGLVATRGRLIQELPKGAMLAVSLSEEEVLEKLPEGLSLAAVNAPNLCVASGNTEIIEKLQKELEGQGTPCRLLHTSHAFHSAMMEGVLPPFMEQVRKVTLKPPQMPYISNVTGKWIMAGEATDPGYWAKHLRQTVRFSEGVQLLLKEPKNVLLEIGPGTTLCTLANRHLERGAKRVVVSSLPHPQEGKTDGESMATALGRLWLSGVKVDWQGYSRHERRHRLPMPTYPFERQRYWIEPGGSRPSANRKQLEKNPNRAEWFYVPSWKRAPMVVSEVFPPPYPLQGGIVPMPVSETSPVLKTCEVLGCWMVFVDGCGVGERLAKRLEEEGREVITVRAGQRYEKVNERAYMLNPGNRNDYDALFAELQRGNTIPGRIVHAWGVTGAEDGETGGEKLLELGYYSLLYLGQVLGRRNVSERFHVVVVTNGVQEVTGEEWLCPEKATVLGPVKVLQQEHPNVRCRSIDVELDRRNETGMDGIDKMNRMDRIKYPVYPVRPCLDFPDMKLTEYLLVECVSESDDTVVAYRGRHRWVQTFEPLRLEDTGKVPKLLREGGVYLITGGLGGIGILLAEYLARTVKAKLILTGRSAFPARDAWESSRGKDAGIGVKIKKLTALESLGAEVLVVKADVAGRREMRDALALAEARFGRINGVFHAAGVTGLEQFHTIGETVKADSERHFQPKIQGTIALEEVLRGREIDFCLLMSSLSSVLGGLGFVAYSSANLFMDAFACRQSRKNSVPWICVNWDAWKFPEEKGQGASVKTALAEFAITPEEGIGAFQHILSRKEEGQVVVSTGNLQARIDQWIKRDVSREPSHSEERTPSALHARPNLPNAYTPPRSRTEQVIAGVWQDLLGVERVGADDNFFELGGHSLLATQALSRLRDTFRVDIPLRALFEGQTVAGLAGHVERIHGAAQKTQALNPITAGEREELEF